MAFTRELTHVLLASLLALMGVIGAATYWAVIGSDNILEREDNPRLILNEAAIQRGSIYDRNGLPLVETVRTENGALERRTYYEAFYSALGYFSLRYGVDGPEAAFNTILRGERLTDKVGVRFERDILHQPQMGEAITLTLDQSIQQRLSDVMQDEQGAAVILSVPSGEVLALISQPTFNPNTLDSDWDTLIEADTDPFFNRALLGQYQPGGILQTPLAVAAVLTGQSFSEPNATATQTVTVDELMLSCAIPPPQDTLTLAQAYAYGCPQPFEQMIERLNDNTLLTLLGSLRLLEPPIIDGFGLVQNVDATAEATLDASVSLRDDLLGQGQLTVNPLGLATLVAAITNNGNAPQPYMLLSTRTPDGVWTDEQPSLSPIPMMTADAAVRLQDLMRANLNDGVANAAARPDLDNGGHAAVAFSGDSTQTWFIGFLRLDNEQAVVIALVLENTGDLNQASEMGMAALTAAAALDA